MARSCGYTERQLVAAHPLVRDPRDAVVSCYHHEVDRNNSGEYAPREWRPAFPDACEAESPPLAGYVRSPIRGIDSLVGFSSDWHERRNDFGGFHRLRHEDLWTESMRHLLEAMAFLQLPCGANVAEGAGTYASLDRMRQLERFGRLPQADLGLPRRPDDARSCRLGPGVVGDAVIVMRRRLRTLFEYG